MTTSAEWTPSDSAWRQAASTAGSPSLSTAARIFTICRSPSSDPASLRRTRSNAVGSTQSLNGRAVAQSARLARQNRHVVPGIINRLAATKAAPMFADDPPVLADHDAIGVGVDVDRPTNGAGADRVFVVVEPDQAGLRHRGRQGVEPVEAATIGNELRPLFLEHLPDRPFRKFRMGMRLSPGNAFVHQPGVQLVIALDPQARREEALAHEADLVLDLALLPARGRRARDRLDKMVRAHLAEAAIVLPILADEDRLHRSFHVVVDAAPAGAPEEGKRPLMGVENHLLGLARIGAHQHHAAMAEANVRDLHGRRHPVHHDDLVAPIELVGLARRKRQRHISARRRARALLAPCPGVAATVRID
jgi:hypothetical protein